MTLKALVSDPSNAPDAGCAGWPAPSAMRGFATRPDPGCGSSMERRRFVRAPGLPALRGRTLCGGMSKEAISRDADRLRTVIDYNLCVGCRMCVYACPFGAMGFDADRGRPYKCDLCGGDPLCVKFCEPKHWLSWMRQACSTAASAVGPNVYRCQEIRLCRIFRSTIDATGAWPACRIVRPMRCRPSMTANSAPCPTT